MKCLSHYMKEASKQSKQLENKDLYQEVQNDPSISINPIMRALENSGIRGDLSNDTLNFPGFNFYLRFTNVTKMFKLQISNFKLWILCRKYLLIFKPSFTSYSSESEFIRKRYKPLFTEN